MTPFTKLCSEISGQLGQNFSDEAVTEDVWYYGRLHKDNIRVLRCFWGDEDKYRVIALKQAEKIIEINEELFNSLTEEEQNKLREKIAIVLEKVKNYDHLKEIRNYINS